MTANTHPHTDVVVTEFHSPPPTRKVEISLMYGDVKRMYKVMMIKNTTWYRPGIWLTEEVVAQICQIPTWEVTILADSLWANIANFMSGHIGGVSVPIP